MSDKQAMLKKCQKLMQLGHWDIQFSMEPPHADHVMEVVTNVPKKTARIRFKPGYQTDEEYNSFILHELLHVVLDEIRWEHRMQVNNSDRYVEFCHRFDHHMEGAVCHLTDVIFALVAQRTEHVTSNLGAGGSNPSEGAYSDKV